MYIVPHNAPAASAAATPRAGWPATAWVEDATARNVAPPNITTAPPSTLKNTMPQRMPSRLFAFHSGNAMLNPMSLIAKMVSVLATAQRQPASAAQTTRCGTWRTSARTADVPRSSAGRLQRARNTPSTIVSEMTTGEMPSDTILVGASAAPSQAPAVNPLSTPTSCSRRSRAAATGSTAAPEDRAATLRREPRTGRRAASRRDADGGGTSWRLPRQLAHLGRRAAPQLVRVGAHARRHDCLGCAVEDQTVIGEGITPLHVPRAVGVVGALEHQDAAVCAGPGEEVLAPASPCAPAVEQHPPVREHEKHPRGRVVAGAEAQRRVAEWGGGAPLPGQRSRPRPERGAQPVARERRSAVGFDAQRVPPGHRERGCGRTLDALQRPAVRQAGSRGREAQIRERLQGEEGRAHSGSSAKWQAASCPGATSRSAGGSVRQRSFFLG